MAMARRLCLVFFIVLASSFVGASEIEDRILDHVDRAAAGGLQPEDFHHLVFAF